MRRNWGRSMDVILHYQGIIDLRFLNSLAIAPRIPAAVKRISREELDCFVAVDRISGNILGFADFGPCRDKTVNADAELYAIYIRQDTQSRGIGKSLFQSGYNSTKTRGYKKMFVSVFEKNEKAKFFYEKMGGRLLNHASLDLGGTQYQIVNYIWVF